MTKIDLDDPLWSRLYGAYGLKDVAGQLRALSRTWDDGLAEALFWDNLHHQSDLYPVTYAALPWLWQIAPRTLDTLVFFSQVLACSGLTRGLDGSFRGPCVGLSLSRQDHAHCWLPADRHFDAEDMDRLRQLQDWFIATAPEMAQTCADSLALASQPSHFSHLLSGWFALRGNASLDQILEHLAAGEPFEAIADEWGAFSPDDPQTLERAAALIAPHDPAFAAEVAAFSGYIVETGLSAG